jgi:hypothetical protein
MSFAGSESWGFAALEQQPPYSASYKPVSFIERVRYAV